LAVRNWLKMASFTYPSVFDVLPVRDEPIENYTEIFGAKKTNPIIV